MLIVIFGLLWWECWHLLDLVVSLRIRWVFILCVWADYSVFGVGLECLCVVGCLWVRTLCSRPSVIGCVWLVLMLSMFCRLLELGWGVLNCEFGCC